MWLGLDIIDFVSVALVVVVGVVFVDVCLFRVDIGSLQCFRGFALDFAVSASLVLAVWLSGGFGRPMIGGCVVLVVFVACFVGVVRNQHVLGYRGVCIVFGFAVSTSLSRGNQD